MQQNKQIRLSYIDNLRVMIVMLVVMTHTACTYSGLGLWYYVENKFPDTASKIFMGSFLSLAQSFDMSFLFLLAGYFIPLSFDVKGPARFIKDRLYRLGIPLIIYMIVIHPIAVKLSRPDLNIISYLINGFTSLSFLGRTGPLWFVLALMIFTGIYALLRISFKNKISFVVPPINIVSVSVLTLIIAIPAFLIRTVMPMGTAFMNFQLAFFSGYVVMFIVGIIAKRLELFDHVDYRTGRKWLIIALTIGYACLGLISIFGGTMRGGREIFGGFTWQSFAYALWESFTCVSITIGLVGIFRNRFHTQNRLQKFLSDNYFGVYVFHPPIQIALSVSLAGPMIHPLWKFTLVAPCAIVASYLFTFLLRRVRFMKIIFS